MTQLLTLSRAAQLLGVSRHVLQKQIHDGQLAAYDGMVASEELLRVYPDINRDDFGIYEPAMPGAGRGFVKSARERILPPKEMLSRRLATQAEELAAARRHLARYHDLIEELQAKLETLAASAPSPAVAELRATLERGLATILGSQEAVDKVEVMDEVLRVFAAHVTVRPSGHEFFVEGAETVLEAALHAGLAPSYGCGNGNCGLCKARVIEGELRQVRNFDYPMSAVEQAQNYKLLCSHTAVSDAVIEMIEAHTPADIPEQQIVARVRSVSPLDERTYLLHLETPRTNRLRFLAGQNVTLGIAGARAHYRGDFPVASCPCDDRNLLFHVRRMPGNLFADYVFSQLRRNDSVRVEGPQGEFILHEGLPRKLYFIAFDGGFAPIKSLIEHALSLNADSIQLHWFGSRQDAIYLPNAGRAWADALDNFGYTEHVAGFDLRTLTAQRETTLLNALREIADRDGGLREGNVYIAGPEAAVTTAENFFLQLGLPATCVSASIVR